MKITLRKSIRVQRCWCAQRLGCGYAQLFPLCPLSIPCASPGGGASSSGPGSHRGQVLSDLPDIHTSFLICLIFLPGLVFLFLPLHLSPRSSPVLSMDLGVPHVRPSFSTTVSLTNAPGMMQERNSTCSNHRPLTFISAPSPWATLQPSPAP